MQNLAKEGQLLAAAGGKQALEQRRYAVEAWYRIARLEQDPAPLFETIQQTAKQVGNLQIRQMTWSGNAETGVAQPIHVEETESGALIEGEIEPFDNDFVAAHQRVQRLVDQLQTSLSERHRIKVLRWPLDSDSGSALEGEFGHSRINARFRIQITEIK